MTQVQEYAQAKSRADVEGALAVCTDDFRLETVPFQLTSVGKEHGRLALTAFFATFPDYDVTLDGLVEGDDVFASWGTVRATMKGDFLSQKATGRSFELPMCCVFTMRDGLLASETFYFDLNGMCEQLGLSTEAVAADLREARRMFQTAELEEAA